MKLYQVDAFTDKIFSGNPAGICLLTSPKDDTWMQGLAMEMNISETAFLEKIRDGYNLRWFTPNSEVDLCGHATLASAHILWETGELDVTSAARFHTKSGLLTANKKDGWIELNFPREDEREAPPPPELIRGLGVNPLYTGRNRMDYIVEVESEDILRLIDPDMEALKKVKTRGIIVTSPSKSGEFDFVSRFFCPILGVNEDPVTGSAHCCLGPYWQKKLKKDSLHAFQASARGGELRVKVSGERVFISGKAITVFTAEMNV